MLEKKVSRDWNKVVEQSNGTMLFLPTKFEKDVKNWDDTRNIYNEKVKEMAKLEMDMNEKMMYLMNNARRYFYENGFNDIYLKDIGFNMEALKDGKFIIDLIDPSKNRIPTS